MSHGHSLSLTALGEFAEVCLGLLHLFDHAAPDAQHHVHDWRLQGEPVRTRNHLVVVECCPCGAVRADRIAHDQNLGCFRRVGSRLLA